jgi:mono/diheme cytochrome c family protein
MIKRLGMTIKSWAMIKTLAVVKTLPLAGALLAASVTGAYGAEKKLPPWEKPIQAGRFLYLEHCSVCHEINKPESKKLGPVLHQVFEKEKMPFSGLPVSEQFIGIKMKVGGGIMPAFVTVLSDDEIDKIIQFMKAQK